VKGHHGRLRDLTLYAPALSGDVHVDVLLPHGYAAHRHERYHVLYLLHGADGDNTIWTYYGVNRLLDQAGPPAHLPPTITVMPDDGHWGFYSDWYGRDIDQPEKVAPGWGTFSLDELIPFIDRYYRTIPTRSGRAIAGLSMGGFGATSLAARSPGTFAAVGTFSGAVDPDGAYPIDNVVVDAGRTLLASTPPSLCVWGDFLTHQIGWEADDPTYLSANLAHTTLFVASGNGTAGPLDPKGPAQIEYNAQLGAIEAVIHEMNTLFVAALDRARIAHTDYFYGPGTHYFRYWQRDLTHFVPILARAWRHPDPRPMSFSDRSAANSFRAWGWHFTAHRAVEEFTYLRNVTSHGFEVAGSGTLHVTDPEGVHFTVRLGSHSSQQTSFPTGDTIPAGWTWQHVRSPV
jgi:S-formylglutathione hydrolase FrmB